MKSITVSAAKNRFFELLERASEGETIQITRRGKPIAKLVPVDMLSNRTPKEAVEGIRQLRKGLNLRPIKIRQLINEGRR